MTKAGNAAPVIIKRKKIIAGGGHHGGAWKVAYADFVTAMMAFFLLMWLLNATTENQLKGLADYFSPSIPVNRVSGGGDGAFGGDNVLSETVMQNTGEGATPGSSTQAGAGSGESGEGRSHAERELEELHEMLRARGGESMATDRAMRHIVSRLTDEGLVVEIYDLPDAPLFAGETAQPVEVLGEIAAVLAEVFALVENGIAVEGHVRAFPLVLAQNPVWPLSAARAQAMRGLLEDAGVAPDRLRRVTGHADRRPAVQPPGGLRNNRLEVIVLRNGAR